MAHLATPPLRNVSPVNAIPPTRAWAEFIAGLKQVTNGKPVLRNRLAAVKSAPVIYWYPGCGTDLSPLILDVPNNPAGQHLCRINAAADDQSARIALWMNDYNTHQDGERTETLIVSECGNANFLTDTGKGPTVRSL